VEKTFIALHRATETTHRPGPGKIERSKRLAIEIKYRTAGFWRDEIVITTVTDDSSAH